MSSRPWEPQDMGVAATGYICQNEPEHRSDLPEVRMKPSPGENCVICPVCGRRAGGPDDEIPYSDEPEIRTDGGYEWGRLTKTFYRSPEDGELHATGPIDWKKGTVPVVCSNVSDGVRDDLETASKPTCLDCLHIGPRFEWSDDWDNEQNRLISSMDGGETPELSTTDSDRDEELITDGGTVDRARFQYASLMRQVSECGPDEQDRVVGFHGKYPESTIQKFIVDGDVVPAKYERLELFEFDERMSDEDLSEWFKENDPFEDWCDEDGFYDPDEAKPEPIADGGLLMATDDPHAEPLLVTEADGLHLPESYIGYEGGLVARMPNGGTIDFKPREWAGTIGNVRPKHFGEVNEDGPNAHLEADEVGLKKYGEDPEVYRVEVRE